jgi:hypothetical protein
MNSRAHDWRSLMASLIVLVLFTALSLGIAPLVEAQENLNARLHGTYAFTQSTQCVETTEGFGPNFQVHPLPPPDTPGTHFIRRVARSTRGFIQFNGDGTATTTQLGTTINFSPVAFPVSESETTCRDTYTVHPDDTVTIETSCTSTMVAGGGIGNVSTITGGVIQATIVQGDTTLLYAPDHPPAVVMISVTPPPGAGDAFTFERVCALSGISSEFAHR